MARRSLLSAFALLVTSSALKADIRADSNRDGRVDITGNTDLAGKATWTDELGALFLANIGDTDRRCSKQAIAGPRLSNEALAACNDASDDIQRAPQYMAPLQTVPINDASPSASGTLSVENSNAAKNVRIFIQNANKQWNIVNSTTQFTADQLKAGLKFGIDSRTTRSPQWDGRTTVTFSVTDGVQTSVDKVALRVAPILTHHHLQHVDQILSVGGNANVSAIQTQFNADLKSLASSVGIKNFFLFNRTDDVWTQDFIEPGYTSMPGPNGTVALRVMIRSTQDDREPGRHVFEDMRNTGVGAVQFLGALQGGNLHEIDGMGNLETIPPYELNGKKYPAGRIVIGSHGSRSAHILPFIRAQELQDPIQVDVDFLEIGHFDEIIQFLPAKTARGWSMMVDDPIAGIQVLKNLQSAGLGSTLAFSRKNDTGAQPANPGAPGGGQPVAVPRTTVDEVLAPERTALNEYVSRKIAANIDVLKKATGLTDAEVFRVPSVFMNASEAVTRATRVGAFYPGTINGIVLNDGVYVSANPWGPLRDGKDVFAEAVVAAYAKAGMTIRFIDDWNTHHPFLGEVHCGTNTVRDKMQPWWGRTTGPNGAG